MRCVPPRLAIWRSVLLLSLLLPLRLSASQDPEIPQLPSPPANKLTVAYYDFSSGKWGADLNLRHTFASTTGWIGAYHQNDGFDQVRVGYQYDYHREWLSATPSVQAATRGFFGASVYAEAGRALFAIVGTGRTNLRPYWNLGFDPNDYFQFGAGYRDRSGNTISVFAIRDDRLHTGQTNTHVYVRRHLPDDWRVTIDAVHERGTGDGNLDIETWALSVDVDWRRWFVRVAADPHVNYTADRQVRIITGARF